MIYLLTYDDFIFESNLDEKRDNFIKRQILHFKKLNDIKYNDPNDIGDLRSYHKKEDLINQMNYNLDQKYNRYHDMERQRKAHREKQKQKKTTSPTSQHNYNPSISSTSHTRRNLSLTALGLGAAAFATYKLIQHKRKKRLSKLQKEYNHEQNASKKAELKIRINKLKERIN